MDAIDQMKCGCREHPTIEITPKTKGCKIWKGKKGKLLTKEDIDVVLMLDKSELDLKYLDLGETNNVWYYGFTVNNKSAIITSDGTLFRDTTERIKDREGYKTIGENQIKELFDYSGYIGDIAPIITNETIKKYYTKISRNHLVKPKEVYKSIRDKIIYYMDFSGKDEIADVMTCWIIATYCYPLFFWFPHILINAPRESGKSKCVFIIIQMSFRGYDIGASGGVTPAQIFRTIEGNRGTMSFDEFEQSYSKGSPISDTQRLVNQILNASPTKDAYVIRTEQINKKWMAWKFPIFCPKVVSNITGINPTSLTRFIAFKWLKTIGEKGKRKPYKEKDKELFEPIRENNYLLILENWEKIKQIYDNLDIKLTSRTEDNWLPLFAIAKFIDGVEGEDVNAEEQLQKYLKGYKEIDIETGDITEELFRIIYEGIKIDNEAQFYRPKDLAEWEEIKTLLGHYKNPQNFIGRTLKLFQFKQYRGGGVRKYLLSKDNVRKVLDTYYSTDKTTHNGTNDT